MKFILLCIIIFSNQILIKGSGSVEDKSDAGSHEDSSEHDPCPVNQVCSRNEEYSICGSHCFDQCPDGDAYMCPLYCEEGCFCKSGYLRDKNGVCVSKNACTQNSRRCKPGEDWRFGNRCLEKCNNLGKFCILGAPQFEYWGCFCIDGHFRDPQNKTCIPENQCPVTSVPSNCCSGPYEVYKKDGNPCMDKCNKDVNRCVEAHKSGCYCRDGYARDVQNGVCRPFPCHDCGEHAHWAVCTGACDNRCDFVLGRSTCTIINIKCPDACRCDKGYARVTDDNSPCIPIENCV